MAAMKPSPWLVVVLVGALAGLVFATVSTYDFVQHLDRQVHSLHCSFIPGGHAESGSSGCQAAMMSPYSSVLRTSIWGGIPIALGAMGVFAFILFYGLDLLVTRRKRDARATAFLALATGLPAATSVVMLIVSLTKLGTTCKLCVGVYIASALCLTGAIMLWRQALAARATMPDTVGNAKNGASLLEVQVEAPATSTRFLAAMFGVGVVFVGAPTVLYAAMAPDHGHFIGTCGTLEQPADTYKVMVPIHRGGEANAVEILDPLCPACKAFEARLDASGFADRLDRKAILFPLDTTCNWMITENTHPGACTVSEAVLCAGDRAPEVIAWAFQVQDRIRAETKADPAAAARIVAQRFPDLASCVGSPEARSRLNKSLRWTVANNIRVLTPQLYVNGTKLCDEDVDIGLDFALSRMIGRAAPAPREPTRPLDAGPAAAATTTPPPAAPPAPTTPPAPNEATPAPAEAPAAASPATAAPETPPAAPVPPPAETPAPTDPMPTEGPVTSPVPAAPEAPPTPEPTAPPAAPADTTGGAP
jgi:uncharacterized membrane protein